MIKVLLIPSSDYLGHPFPQRYNYIFERLHNKNIEVHVILFNLSDSPKIKSNVIVHNLNFEIKIYNIKQYYLVNFILAHNIELLNIIRKYGINVVVSNLTPYLMTNIIEKLLKMNVALIYDMQDYYPISATGYITNRNNIIKDLLHNSFSQIMKIMIKHSDAITAASRLLAKLAYKMGGQRAYFVPNGILEHFLLSYQAEGRRIREKLGLDNAIVLGFVGSLEFWLDFMPIFRAVRSLIKKGIDTRLVIIGQSLHTKYENIWNDC